MAAEALPCDSCGSPISDSDLETGTAITLIGKRYCPGCKTEAIQNVSLEDLAVEPGARRPAPPKAQARPAPAAPKPPPSAARPPEPRAVPKAPEPKALPKPPAPSSPSPVRPDRRAPPPRRPARAPGPSRRNALVIGLLVAGIGVGVAAVVFGSRGTPAGPAGPPGPAKAPPAASASPLPPGPARDSQARDAYSRVEELGRRAGVSWELVLAAADKARPACRGTPWEAQLEELRSKALRDKEVDDAARELAPLIDELKGAVATDPEFKRYVELQPKFQLALEIAGKTQSIRMAEIRALHLEYNGKYEKLAEPFFDRINEAATALAQERRYDDALRQIDTFPQQFRHSVSWQTLQRLRQDIERRKQVQPKK